MDPELLAELDEDPTLAHHPTRSLPKKKGPKHAVQGAPAVTAVRAKLPMGQGLTPTTPMSVMQAVKLSYNQLSRVDGLDQLLGRLQLPAANLRWLDLSFNQFTTVDESLALCTGLTHLYLHANAMENLSGVARALAKMPFADSLVTLTLHGNPLADHKDYKVHILRACRRLRHLDHGGVTRSDRSLARHAHGVAGGVKASSSSSSSSSG
ncbi:hypothetical protein BC828DRAFT_376572 [Blastocladiella britannica]|nr:hypothetical protein BC828DRAFT_376572 [Blastocladiella britannica]